MKTNKLIGSIIIASQICFVLPVFAENLDLSKVWSQINTNSAAQESSRLQTESLSESESRSNRHWLPRIYVGALTYQTNDPGTSFFGLLSQRSLLQSDFNPDAINHPDSKGYTKGALGIDLPLYEGGMKSSQSDLYTNLKQAQENTTSQVQIEQFAQVSLSYASIAILKNQNEKINILNTQIESLLKNYQLGSKSNPVGYSGLLGMKSLLNRLTGLKQQLEAQIKSNYIILKELGLKNENWSPVKMSAVQFVEKYLATKDTNLPSYKILSMKKSVAASEDAAQMEKARYLPRLGAFAESQIFNGDRDTSNSYIAGLYLQWNLFDPSSFGTTKEARLKSDSLRKGTEALEQQERAEKFALTEAMNAYQKNIILLDDSYKILLEQSKITQTLFKNGSINALQFVEVLSRRADLIAQQSEAEIGLVKSATQNMTKKNFNLTQTLAE
jgi:outer membrane protein TolC